MKIAHWIINAKSGMNATGEGMCSAERAIGLDSHMVFVDVPATHEIARDADIHVMHTHMSPEAFYATQRGRGKLVFIPHGTPEHVFQSAIMDSRKGYGHADGWMLTQHWLRTSDAVVTFWDRHAEIWDSMTDRNKDVYSVEMGIDLDAWGRVPVFTKWAGSPSVFTSENAHPIKWPLDLFMAWPFVVKDPALHGARLHCIYLPSELHRWFFPLINSNGASFSSYVSDMSFDRQSLKSALSSTDYYIGLVRYGDYNNMCLQAKACGSTVISYEGNPYADYWITEGDQLRMAEQLKAIFKGEAERRETRPVRSMVETAKEMKGIYEQL